MAGAYLADIPPHVIDERIRLVCKILELIVLSKGNDKVHITVQEQFHALLEPVNRAGNLVGIDQ